MQESMRWKRCPGESNRRVYRTTWVLMEAVMTLH